MSTHRAKPGPKAPYRQLMLELHIPRSDKDPHHWSTTVFVSLLDESSEDKKKVGEPIPANGLEDVPRVIERILEERRGLVLVGKEIRPQTGTHAAGTGD